MDHAAWLAQGMTGADEQLKEAYKYWMRPDPNQREFLGPVQKVEDPLTGREMRYREAKVGMTRNPSPERMRPVRVYLDPLPHIRLDHGKDLQGWYQGKELSAPGSRVRPCMTDALLTEPYGGYCTVGCTFCYINSGGRGYRGSGLVSVPVGYGAHIARQLDSLKIAQAGYFSSFTDPFLPLEDYYHNTQRGAEAFTARGLPVFFLSRLGYPSWAMDLLMLNPHSYAQKSINTPDPQDWEKLSPGAAPLSQHFDEIRELRRRGVYVSIQCNPVVPGITPHEEVEKLIGLLGEAGANHVIVKFVEANHPWAKAMVERITKRFGENRASAFRDLFVENSCGGQKTVTEEYRREGHVRYRKAATEAGMTYSLCYEYTKASGEWKSMGPEFLTADQCHGHRVPFYTRTSERTIERGAAFAPLDVCPPSGCLSCADGNGGKGACGSDLLGSAKALRLPDLRRDPGFTSSGG